MGKTSPQSRHTISFVLIRMYVCVLLQLGQRLFFFIFSFLLGVSLFFISLFVKLFFRHIFSMAMGWAVPFRWHHRYGFYFQFSFECHLFLLVIHPRPSHLGEAESMTLLR